MAVIAIHAKSNVELDGIAGAKAEVRQRYGLSNVSVSLYSWRDTERRQYLNHACADLPDGSRDWKLLDDERKIYSYVVDQGKVVFEMDDGSYRVDSPSGPSFGGGGASGSKNTGTTEGCFVATVVYGDYDHPKVRILREFRDNSLKASYIGTLLIRLYYKASPALVATIKDRPLLLINIRMLVDLIVAYLARKQRLRKR